MFFSNYIFGVLKQFIGPLIKWSFLIFSNQQFSEIILEITKEEALISHRQEFLHRIEGAIEVIVIVVENLLTDLPELPTIEIIHKDPILDQDHYQNPSLGHHDTQTEIVNLIISKKMLQEMIKETNFLISNTQTIGKKIEMILMLNP